MRIILNKRIGPALALVVALGLGACSPARDRNAAVTSVYPVAFAATQIAAGDPLVRNLAAAGVEPHDLELTTRQVDLVQDAALVFMLTPGFQPALDDAVRQRRGPTVDVLADLPGIAQQSVERDPHVWLDPILMRDVVRNIGNALIALKPSNTDAYRTRMAELDAQLGALDREYRAGLAPCRRHDIFVAHDAFGWLAQRYGLTQVSVAGRNPETEPSAARLAELADQAKRAGATTIFTEELVSPKLAETLAREAGGLKVATLSPIESLTPEQAKSGADYFSLMRANLAELRAALGCV